MEKIGVLAAAAVRKLEEDEARFEEQERNDARRRERGLSCMFDEVDFDEGFFVGEGGGDVLSDEGRACVAG